jgi:hypothetical protein
LSSRQILILRRANIKGRALYFAQEHVPRSNAELALLETQRHAAIAASARLMEHHRPMLFRKLADQRDGGWSSNELPRQAAFLFAVAAR